MWNVIIGLVEEESMHVTEKYLARIVILLLFNILLYFNIGPHPSYHCIYRLERVRVSR